MTRSLSLFIASLLLGGVGTACERSGAVVTPTVAPPEATPIAEPLESKPIASVADGGGVAVLGFGGTIAGKADGPFNPNYSAGGVCLAQPEAGGDPGIVDILLEQQVLKSCEPSRVCDVPNTGCRGASCQAELGGNELPVSFCDIERLDSAKVTPANWLIIAERVEKTLAQPDVRGVVITHGTDTLEETAYLLDLVLATDKPVVVAAAMRASNHLSADGYMNLMSAIALAASPEAEGRGVLVVLDDTIFAARNVTKAHTTNPAAFESSTGSIGEIYFGEPRFHAEPRAQAASDFNIDTLRSVIVQGVLSKEAETEIIYEYAGGTGRALSGAIGSAPESPIMGVVVASSGNGGVSSATERSLALAAERGLYVAFSSRTGAGYVTSLPKVDGLNSLSAKDLSPQQARVLLILGLAATRSCKPGQPCFDQPSRRAMLQAYFDRH